MDLDHSPADDAFRVEVRTWLEANLPRTLRDKVLNHKRLSREDYLDWHRRLATRGWSAPAWPVEYGGPGWDATRRFIWDEECARAGTPSPLTFGVSMVGPVLMKYGNEAQKRHYLPRILDGSDWWCQGYSEPGSGSDLASLRTRAERRGDHYLVNGQKTWTTLGQYADMMFCLVRTDTAVKKQEGISFLLIDMKTPGITVRPIITLDEEHEVNEVFFEDVLVPLENLVGEENRGWTYAKYLLGHERTSIARVGTSKRELRFLKRIAAGQRRNGRSPPGGSGVRRPRGLAGNRPDGAGGDRAARGQPGSERARAGPRGLDAEDQGLRDPAGADRADGRRDRAASPRRSIRPSSRESAIAR